MIARWFRKQVLLLVCIAAVMAAMSFVWLQHHANNDTELHLQLSHYVGNQVLALDTVTYTNALHQPYTVTKFKYYLCNMQWQRKDGQIIQQNDYYLIDEDDTDSKHIMIKNLPAGEYTSLTYTIGVDSLHNCSGAQTGALDPVHAMFWAWNTGYIFFKLEGKSSSSESPGHFLEYHIGGYKAPNNMIREVTIDFGNTPLVISHTAIVTVHLKADIAEVLQHNTTIDFSKTSSVTEPNKSAAIADNYRHMFILQGITYSH
jgi:hypothetical protein